jgi:ankyrin repeat protein
VKPDRFRLDPQRGKVLHCSVRAEAKAAGGYYGIISCHGVPRDRNTDPDVEGIDGQTPLHVAASEGRGEIAGLLIRAGAEVNATDDIRETPLHKAARANRPEVAKRLAWAGANVEAREGAGNTPLHVAAAEDNTEVARVLLAAGSDPNGNNGDWHTPLHLAVQRGHMASVRLLIRVTPLDMHGDTLLSIAERRGHDEIEQLLSEHGATPF